MNNSINDKIIMLNKLPVVVCENKRKIKSLCRDKISISALDFFYYCNYEFRDIKDKHKYYSKAEMIEIITRYINQI